MVIWSPNSQSPGACCDEQALCGAESGPQRPGDVMVPLLRCACVRRGLVCSLRLAGIAVQDGAVRPTPVLVRG